MQPIQVTTDDLFDSSLNQPDDTKYRADYIKSIAAKVGDITVDDSEAGTIGTPTVEVETSGSDLSKNIKFTFKNLKGETGPESPYAESDHTTAAEDHAKATADHSTASSDHTIAASDHQKEEEYATKEATRQSSEDTRKSNEDARESNEETRQSNELLRQSHETTRVSQESTRQSEETKRQSAEATRQSTFQTNESARQSTFNTNETTRQNTFNTSEASRTNTFNNNEVARDAKVDEKVEDITNLESQVTELAQEVGDLKDLQTEAHGSLVEAINEVYGYAFEEDGHVYGVRHYFNQSSPVLTRFQTSTSHDLHQLLPVQSLMRRCLLLDDGTVNYYLDHEDSTKKENGEDAVLDGTDGMVMVEIPAHYRKHTLVENTDDASLSYYETAISLLPFSGAFKVNKCYISAYEASMDRTNNKLSSVVNTTEQYRGGNNNSAWDGTYRDLRGKPASVISLTNFRTYARNRGALWNCQEWDVYNTLYWLYTIEYANLNCQLAYNSNRDGSGYHQGGLGAGVSEINYTKWNSLYSCYPVVPCGVTNSLGNASGVVAYDIPDDADGILYTPNVPSYRGVENPFGHIWKWMDGFLAIGNGTTQEYYICHDRTQYASAKNNYYVSKGQSAGANGYIKEFVRNDEGDILCNVIGGGSTTYGCDYHYESFANGTTYGVYSGGAASNGAAGGFGCLSSHYAPTDTYAYIGSRLCWSSHQSLIEKE